MAADDAGDRTEQPTEHRRREERQKGNVARSQDLSAAALMVAVAFALATFGNSLVRSLMGMLRQSIRNAHAETFETDDAVRMMQQSTEYGLLTVAPIFLMMAIAAILANLVQVGFLISPEALQPKLARLDPIAGMKRIFSIRSIVKLLVSLSKLAIVVSISVWLISAGVSGFLELSGHPPRAILVSIQSSVVELAMWLALALFVLALIDFGFQKWKHEQDLRMTKQEIRDEMKQMEGDPQMRQRRKEAHQKLAQSRELQQVKDADVVIKNPTHIAVALKYDPETMPAPMVVAKGKGVIAERIHKIAVENDVPIIERKPLARALYAEVKVGQLIPVDMYDAFVEIMAYVYRLTGRTPPNLD